MQIILKLKLIFMMRELTSHQSGGVNKITQEFLKSTKRVFSALSICQN
jgi:hypothetical protein